MINAASCISSSLTEYRQRYATVRPNHPTSSPNVPREKASPSQIFLCRKACHTWTIVTPQEEDHEDYTGHKGGAIAEGSGNI